MIRTIKHLMVSYLFISYVIWSYLSNVLSKSQLHLHFSQSISNCAWQNNLVTINNSHHSDMENNKILMIIGIVIVMNNRFHSAQTTFDMDLINLFCLFTSPSCVVHVYEVSANMRHVNYFLFCQVLLVVADTVLIVYCVTYTHEAMSVQNRTLLYYYVVLCSW